MDERRRKLLTALRAIGSVLLQCATVLVVAFAPSWRYQGLNWYEASWLVSPGIPLVALGFSSTWIPVMLMALVWMALVVFASKPQGRGLRSWIRLLVTSVGGAFLWLSMAHSIVSFWPAPRPFITPYETEPEAKATYLHWYKLGFRHGLQPTRLICVLGWSELDQHGYYAGNDVGYDLWQGITGATNRLTRFELKLLKGDPETGWSGLPDPKELGRDQRTPLIAACDSGLDIPETIAGLIKMGADVSATDKDGNTALVYAARRGKLAVVKILLGHGAASGTNHSAGAALCAAAITAGPEVIKLLLDHGADVNARTKWGDTPLMVAARYGRTELVELLLKHGADLEAKDSDGRRLLENWVLIEKPEQIIPLLIRYGAKVDFLWALEPWERRGLQEFIAAQSGPLEEAQ